MGSAITSFSETRANTNLSASLSYFFFKSEVSLIFIYLFSAVQGLHCCAGHSPVAVLGLLTSVVSLVVERRLEALRLLESRAQAQ